MVAREDPPKSTRPRLRCRIATLLTVASVAILAAGARAQAQPLPAEPGPHEARLTYRAPTDCPTEQAFRDHVLGRLGRTPFHEKAKRRIDVQIEHRDRAFHARLSLPAERVFDSPDCEDLVATTAMIVALELDAAESPSPPSTGASSHRSSTEWRRELSPGARSALEALDQEHPPSRAGRPPPALPASTTGWDISLGIEVLAGLGLVPAAALGGQLAVGFHRESFSLYVEGRGETSIGTEAHEEVRAVTWAGAVAPCGSLAPFFSCVVLAAGGMAARAERVVSPRWTTSFYASGAARIGFELVLGRARLRGAAEAEVPITRPDFRIGDQLVWQVSPVVGRLHLGLAWILP